MKKLLLEVNNKFMRVEERYIMSLNKHLLRLKKLEPEMKMKNRKEEKVKKKDEKQNIWLFKKKELIVVKRMLLLKLNGINVERIWKNLKNCKKFLIYFLLNILGYQ